MTEIKQFFTGAAADSIPRDRWSRPLIKQADGKTKGYQRCTTFVGPLEDTSNLTKWKMRQAALGLVARPALRMAVAAAKDDNRKLNSLMEQCLDAAGSSDKADLGTAIHKFTENYDNGLDVSDMPPDFRPDLDAYIAATSIFEVLAVEQFVVVDELAVAGTADRIIRYNGVNYIADVKTGSIDYGIGKICMQLAVYAHGAQYDPESGARSPLPEVSQTAGIVIHLPAGTGTCELVWVNIQAGWEAAVNLAVGVQAWRKRKDLSKPFVAPAPVVPAQMELTLGQQELAAVEPLPAPAVTAPAAPVSASTPETPQPLAEIVAETHAAAQTAGAAVAATHAPPGNQTGYNKLAAEASAAIMQAIAGAVDVHTLNVLWELNQTVWDDGHTVAARARRKELGA